MAENEEGIKQNLKGEFAPKKMFRASAVWQVSWQNWKNSFFLSIEIFVQNSRNLVYDLAFF